MLAILAALCRHEQMGEVVRAILEQLELLQRHVWELVESQGRAPIFQQ